MTPSSTNRTSAQLFLVGTGRIGGTLLDQLAAQVWPLRKEHDVDLKVVAVADADRQVWNRSGLTLGSWRDDLAKSSEPMDSRTFLDRILAFGKPNRVFVDCTASEDVASSYTELLRASVSVVTPNKKANSGSLRDYRRLRAAARRSGAQFRYETNVGAGLPIIGPLQDMIQTGDTVTRIEGVFSGTLSYLFNAFVGDVKFSDVVRHAHELGYTEPDPRDDLGGVDVARKLLILAREIGYDLDRDDVEVESLVPASCQSATTVDAFFAALERENESFEAKKRTTEQAGQRLRYVGMVAGRRASVCLRAVGSDHPLSSLSGNDNKITITSHRYHDRPLVIQGPGAGADVTAAGVFADILKTVRTL